ncbi:Reticulocyte-binding protein 2 homolog a [Durusdinium trenchii]|uniref:Reticulocyte-binding protein 2 homolog a n=1 Tax=Durusdinium trenchii TaxID=1381693 RepID=A0ABP0RE45_9DINO
MGAFVQPSAPRAYWVTPVVLPPSASPSPLLTHRSVRSDGSFPAASCIRLFSQPSLPSSPVQVVRQVSLPAYTTRAPHPFPKTPRFDFQPERRATIPKVVEADSPRNTILPQAQTPPTRPLKIRVVASQLNQLKRSPPKDPHGEEAKPQLVHAASAAGSSPCGDALLPTLLRSRGVAARKQMEVQRAKAEEIRAFERRCREAVAEQRRADAERLRMEAERQRAELQKRGGDAQRRQVERRESLAEDLRRLAEEKRRARQEEQQEVERKRAEAQRSRMEAASRRLHRSRLRLVEEKHRLAEEARRAIEEGRRRRFTEPGKARFETARGRRSETDARRKSLEGGKRRAKSADADQECEAERRKAEQERQRLEEEEAEVEVR